jgi:hypothetical protein
VELKRSKLALQPFKNGNKGPKKPAGASRELLDILKRKGISALILSDNSYSSDAVRLPDHLMMPPKFC